MSIWYDYQVERQRREDEAAQAAAHRENEWHSHVLHAAANPTPRYHRLMVFVGGVLVNWGTQLQQRYATLKATDAPTTLYPDPLGDC